MSTVKKIAAASTLAIMLIVFTMSALLVTGAVGSSGTGAFPLSLNFLGCYQPYPFIIGSEIGGPPVLGWDVSPWAFGLQSCVRSLPLYFNAHGFGFPFTLGNYRIALIPPIC